MPSSSIEGKQFFREWVSFFKPNTILDVGPGVGTYGKIVREVYPQIIVDCIEIYSPYIHQFSLWSIYDKVLCDDIRKNNIVQDYDLVIFGDVLEHLNRDEATFVWNYWKPKAQFLWLSLPVKLVGRKWSYGYNQPACEYEINKNEQHMYDWGYEELLADFGPFLWQIPYPTVVVLVAEGDV